MFNLNWGLLCENTAFINQLSMQIRFFPEQSAACCHAYRMLGMDIFSDYPLQDLSSFKSPSEDFPCPQIFDTEKENRGDWNASNQFQGEMHGEIYQFELSIGSQFKRLTLPGVADYYIAQDGSVIYSCRTKGSTPTPLEIAGLLGPAFILANLDQNIFFLHASAVLGENGATIFCAHSGVGKSTIAHSIDQASADLCQIADDLVALESRPGQIPQCLVYNYQPKFPHMSGDPELPEVTNIERIIFLDLNHDSTNLRSDLFYRLCNSVMGSNIPAKNYISRVNQFCKEVLETTPCMVQSYSHNVESIEGVLRLITE